MQLLAIVCLSLGTIIAQWQSTFGPVVTELVGSAARSFIYLIPGWTVEKCISGQNNLRQRNIENKFLTDNFSILTIGISIPSSIHSSAKPSIRPSTHPLFWQMVIRCLLYVNSVLGSGDKKSNKTGPLSSRNQQSKMQDVFLNFRSNSYWTHTYFYFVLVLISFEQSAACNHCDIFTCFYKPKF